MTTHTSTSVSIRLGSSRLSPFWGSLALGQEKTRGLEGLWVEGGQGAGKGHPRTIPRNMGPGCRMMHQPFFPPPSPELRLSAEARKLGEESAGCGSSQGKRVTCSVFIGKGKGREGSILAWTQADKQLWGAADREVSLGRVVGDGVRQEAHQAHSNAQGRRTIPGALFSTVFCPLSLI